MRLSVATSKCFASLTKLAVGPIHARITLAHSASRNAFGKQMVKELHDRLSQVIILSTQRKIKMLVVDAEGPVFSAGHNLKQLQADPGSAEALFLASRRVIEMIRALPIPTLGLINGSAVAAGLQFALAMDMLVASQRSTFGTPGVKWGLFCSTPGVELTRAISSSKKANEMLLFGQLISAQEALNLGLINKVTPEAKLEEEVKFYSDKVAKLSSEVISYGKTILAAQRKEGYSKGYDIAVEAMAQNIALPDCKEGLQAFAAKRHPHFKN